MLIIGGIILGFFASFISALFGGGSGLIFVPGIFWLLVHTHSKSPYLMQTALGTCFFLSIFIGVIASMRQVRYGNVDKQAFLRYGFWVLLGAFIAAVSVMFINTHFLKTYFSIVILLVALWMYRRRRHAIENESASGLAKAKPANVLASILVGFLSITTGVAVFSVPFLLKMGLNLRRAIATSTVIVFMFTVFGASMLLIVGLSLHHLPKGNIGLVNVPIALSALVPTFVGSIIGAKLAHVLPQQKLGVLFIAMMTIVGLLMLIPH